MANPQLIWRLSLDFFRRNNLLEAVLKGVFETVHYICTYSSQMKLMRFRFMLYQQQLLRMEQNLQAGGTAVHGNSFDRNY
ncbi:MAG: hypothetical protein SFZ03_04390 [Candidatus Melainabacteria bacterium]|nr:hypothetical protein [Candidatus Melainabacteria bacterium]